MSAMSAAVSALGPKAVQPKLLLVCFGTAQYASGAPMIAAECSLNRVAAAAAVQLDHIVRTARCAAARCRCATVRRCTTRECHTLTVRRQLHTVGGNIQQTA